MRILINLSLSLRIRRRMTPPRSSLAALLSNPAACLNGGRPLPDQRCTSRQHRPQRFLEIRIEVEVRGFEFRILCAQAR